MFESCRAHMSRLLVVVGVVAIALSAALVARTSGNAVPTRSCGTLGKGIGWHLRASPNVRCTSARRVINTFFAHKCHGTCTVLRYACRARYLSDAEQIRCIRPSRLVVARSFGY
jgi:hypothetical protein